MPGSAGGLEEIAGVEKVNYLLALSLVQELGNKNTR